MALPNPGWYTTGDMAVPDDEHDFGECQAGEYSTGKIFRLYNAKGSTTSDTMTSVKISIRDDDGGTDDIWVQQHWVQVKSAGGSTGLVDDEQTVYTAVGKNKELSVGNIPSGEYRTIYTRCYPPTDAEENASIEFQLRTTYQQPATSICNWITGLRGNGVVASTGNPFAMFTGGTTGTIPYEAGYALINNNEIYYGSSGIYDCSTGTSSTGHKIYLTESGSFGMTTGDVDANQLLLYEATISSGVCTALDDKRVYLAGLQAGTTGAIPSNPDLGDLYFGTNGKLYGAETAGTWTVIVPGADLTSLTDTPGDYIGDASKILTVTTGEDGVEFLSSTGIALDSLGTPTTGTSLNATTGYHGLLPILSGSSGEYLDGDGNFKVPPATDIEVSEIGTATYDDVQDWLNNTQSGGRVSGGVISDDSSGGIAISSGTGMIKSTTGDIGLTKSFDWSADAIVSTGLTDNSANYVYIDYSTGAPAIKVTATRGNIHLSDHFTLGRVYKSGTDLHILQSGVNLYNAVRRSHERLVAVRNFERASGGVISESADTERALTSTIGNFYLGANKITTEAQDTSTGDSDYFTTHYYIDGAWASSTGQQQISNTQWNNPASTGLETLTVNRYGVHWAYIHFDSDIHVVYGQGDYTLAQAEIAVVPDSLPSFVEDFGILASKIIIQKNSTGFNSIVTAYKVLFPVSNPAEHNDLGALDTADYQHLTQAEHDEITKWAGAVTLSTGGAINLVAFSTGGTVNIPSGQEYQINGAEVKLDEWATPTDVTTLNATTGYHGLLLKLDGSTSNYLRGDGTWETPPGATGAGVTTFLGLTDTPADYTDDASKLLRVNASSGAVEFVSTTGIALDTFGTPTDVTTNNATTGYHGLLLKLDGNTSNYLRGDGSWQPPPGATGGEANTASNVNTTGVGVYEGKVGIDLQFKGIHSTGDISVTDSTGTHTINLDVISTGIKLDDLGTPDDNTDLNATTGYHGLLPKFSGTTGEYLSATGGWSTPPDTDTDTFLGLTDTPADYTDDGGKYVKVSTGEDALEFSTPPGGEANTASNVNTTGVGVYEGKVDIDLQFKGIRAGSPKVTVTDSTGTHTISIDLSGVVTSSGAFTANAIPQISSSGGVLKASVFTATTGDVFDFGAHSAGFTEQAIATTTGTVAVNWNSGNKALYTRSTGTAGGAATFTFTAPVKSANLMLTVRGSTVGSTGTVTWPAIKWDGGSAPTLGSGASDINVVSFYYSTGLTSYLGASSTGTFSS